MRLGTEFRGKKILVTGALGFIGRSLLETLVVNGCEAELPGIDIKEMATDAEILKQRVRFDRIDIRDEQNVSAYVRDNCFDGVVHLAAVSRVVDAENDKRKCIDTNYGGTKHVVEAVSQNAGAWLVFGSSREVYGEQTNFPVSEGAELLPINVYGFYKLEGERIVRRLLERYCILRFSNVYGNTYDIPERVVPKFVRTAMDGGEISLEGGEQIIDFTHIDDTVASVVKCMELLDCGCMKQDVIHVLPGRQNRITDVVDVLRKLGFSFSVAKRPSRAYDVQKFVGDPAKCNKVLWNGAMRFTELQDGIERLVDLYRNS